MKSNSVTHDSESKKYDGQHTIAMYQRFNVNNTNMINEKTMFQALQQLNVTSDEVMDILRIIDDKYDGHVSCEVFCQLVYVLQTADMQNPYSVLFSCADLRHQQKVTVKHVEDLLKKMGFKMVQYSFSDLIKLFLSSSEENQLDYNAFVNLINFILQNN